MSRNIIALLRRLNSTHFSNCSREGEPLCNHEISFNEKLSFEKYTGNRRALARVQQLDGCKSL